MTSSKPKIATTYDRASGLLKPYVLPLWPGTHAPAFSIRDQDGRTLALQDDHISGRPVLIVLLNKPDEADQLMQALAHKQAELQKLNISVLVVSADSNAGCNAALRQRAGFSWPVLGDSTGAVFAGFGLHKGSETFARAAVLTANHQVRAWFDFDDTPDQTLGAVMSELEQSQCGTTEHSTDYWATMHAPVLQVPAVLSREECGQLIRQFEKEEPLMIRPPRSGELPGNYKIPVYEHNRQDRIDQIIKDQQTLGFLDERIWGRVVPMVKKAFAYEITRREDLHVARYVGARGGNTMGHRDNVSNATAYRRFALSLNLNDDYEGGEVVFKEYGDQRYKSVAGTALVFSSALLHEVLETTQGTRYTLISHFFNEQSLPGSS